MIADLLVELWGSWAERGAVLTPEQWRTPTRLPGWTVHALYAHVAPDPVVMRDMLAATITGDGAVLTGADALRAFNKADGFAHTGADAIADQAVREAESISTATLLRRFVEGGAAAVAALGEVDLTTVVAHPHLGSVTYLALAELAIVDTTVHMLDLIAAVGGPPVPEAALGYTRQVLAAVPEAVDFIEAATGRTETVVLPVMR